MELDKCFLNVFNVGGSRPLTDDEQLYIRLLELGECMFLVL